MCPNIVALVGNGYNWRHSQIPPYSDHNQLLRNIATVPSAVSLELLSELNACATGTRTKVPPAVERLSIIGLDDDSTMNDDELQRRISFMISILARFEQLKMPLTQSDEISRDRFYGLAILCL